MNSITHTLLSELLDKKATEEDFEKHWKSYGLKESECGQFYKIIRTAAFTAYLAGRLDFAERKMLNV